MLFQVRLKNSEIIEKDSFGTHFGQPYSHFMKQFSQTMTEIVKEMTVVTQVLDPKYPLSKLTVSHVLEDHSKLITTINICEKRNLLISGSLDWTVKLWDLQDTTLLKTFKDTKPVYDALLSCEGRFLAYCGESDVIHLIELQYLKNNHIVSELKGHSYFVTRLIFSNDEIYLISGSWYSWDNILIASHSYLKEIKIWSFKNQKLLCTQEGHSKGTGIQFSNDQQVLISSGEDGKIKLWSLIANSMIQKVFLTADSRFIISYCFKDQLVKVMDSNTGEQVKMFKVQKQGEGDFAGLSITKKLNIITYGDDRKSYSLEDELIILLYCNNWLNQDIMILICFYHSEGYNNKNNYKAGIRLNIDLYFDQIENQIIVIYSSTAHSKTANIKKYQQKIRVIFIQFCILNDYHFLFFAETQTQSSILINTQLYPQNEERFFVQISYYILEYSRYVNFNINTPLKLYFIIQQIF